MAKQKIDKTNAARLLDKAKILYELIPYEVDENDLAATHVAEQLGEDIATVFKTLILTGDRNGFLVCVVPGNHEVDLKAAARVSGNKKVEMLPMKELLPTTGYIRGGCSPIGMKKRFPTYIHTTCNDHPFIYISAGVRGLQIRIAPTDLVKFVGAEIAPISHDLDKPEISETIAEIREQHEKYGIHRFALTCPGAGWRTTGLPPESFYRERAEAFRIIQETLAPEGIELAWWNTLTLKSGPDPHWNRMIRMDGSETPMASCPLNPDFKKEFARLTALFAEIAKPVFIITEDD
ncbi:MAG: Cys-tRNA(Pro) deacylase, partial [Alistipes sp.]|nr:Cys-tRNA(Pro) deacylase [Alistipes sp.]